MSRALCKTAKNKYQEAEEVVNMDERIPVVTIEEVEKEEEDEDETESEASQGSGGGGGEGSAGGEVLGSRQLPYAVGGALQEGIVTVEEEEKEASQGV